MNTLHAEWTKFRTVRGRMVAMMAAGLVTVLLGLMIASGSHAEEYCGGYACPAVPIGPGGEAVIDGAYLVHRALPGNGGITVQVGSMTGVVKTVAQDQPVPGLEPWAKAGIIVKESTRAGAAYAAMMVTGAHGVRMQHDFTEDTAGSTSARWLRLTRSGDTITGFESVDGATWIKVGTARLAASPSTVRIGLFVASPSHVAVEQRVGGVGLQMSFTQATADFDHVDMQGVEPGAAWSSDDIGAVKNPDGTTHHAGAFAESGGVLTLSGSGDTAPRTDGQSVERTLVGVFLGLVVVMVVGAAFIATEYRRLLIRTTLAATPRRGRVLLTKAGVVGAVTFGVGLVAAAVAVPLCTRILESNGNYVLPVSALTEARVVVGSALLLAVGAVFAFGLGAVFRRSVAAVAAALVAIVLPYVLATSAALPLGVSQWLLRITPAAGFAIQQSIPEYPQVTGFYAPVTGYFPLAPWAGFAVLCAYAAGALGLAFFLIRRRDA